MDLHVNPNPDMHASYGVLHLTYKLEFWARNDVLFELATFQLQVE